MEAQVRLELEQRLEPARPVLKWAGGKTQLLRSLRKAVPETFGRYVEPFLGGGALFFDLAPPGALVSDSNAELVQFYGVVRERPEELAETALGMPITKEDYYRVRALAPDTLEPVRRAARFLYLNKTCYNGLHRVNREGRFNTPFGGRTNVRVVDRRALLCASAVLRAAELRCADYAEVVEEARPGDFVYLDPPYLPLGGYSDFRRYTRQFFGRADHIRLAEEFRALDGRGVRVLLSNAAHRMIERLYEGFEMRRVAANRYINCRAEGRGEIDELLIANYPLEL